MPQRTQGSFQQLSQSIGQVGDAGLSMYTARNKTRYQMSLDEWDNTRHDRLNEFVRTHDPTNDTWEEDLTRLQSELEQEMEQRIGNNRQQQMWFREDYSRIKSEMYNRVEEEFFQREAQYSVERHAIEREGWVNDLAAEEANQRITEDVDRMVAAGHIRSDQALRMLDEGNKLVLRAEAGRYIREGIAEREENNVDAQTMFTDMRRQIARDPDLTEEVRKVMLEKLGEIENAELRHRREVQESNVTTGVAMIERGDISSAISFFGFDSNPNDIDNGVYMDAHTRHQWLQRLEAMQEAIMSGDEEDRQSTNKEMLQALWNRGYWDDTTAFRQDVRRYMDQGLISWAQAEDLREKVSREQTMREVEAFRPILNYINSSNDLRDSQKQSLKDHAFDWLTKERYAITGFSTEGGEISADFHVFHSLSTTQTVQALENYVETLKEDPDMIELFDLDDRNVQFEAGRGRRWNRNPYYLYHKMASKDQLVGHQMWDDNYNAVNINEFLLQVSDQESKLLKGIHTDSDVIPIQNVDGTFMYEIDAGRNEEGEQLVHLYRWRFNEEEDQAQLQRYHAAPGEYRTQVGDREIRYEILPGDHWRFVTEDEERALFDPQEQEQLVGQQEERLQTEAGRRATSLLRGSPSYPETPDEAKRTAQVLIEDTKSIIDGDTRQEIVNNYEALRSRAEDYAGHMQELGVDNQDVLEFKYTFSENLLKAYREALEENSSPVGERIRQGIIDAIDSGEIVPLWPRPESRGR